MRSYGVVDWIEGEPLPWLLQPENPSVRFWTLCDLLARPADDLELRLARAAIPTFGPVAEPAQPPRG